MRKISVLAVVLMVPAGAFAQAVAEGALAHSLSTSMGTAVGKALGSATNQAANRVAGQVQQTSKTTPRAVVTIVKPGVQNQNKNAGTTAEPLAGGTLIQSIQGAKLQPACPAVKATESEPKPAAAQP